MHKNLLRKFLVFWELPQVLLALIILAAINSRITYCMNYRDARIYFVKRYPGGISLSYFIFLNENEAADVRVLRHEYGHTLQSLYLGWLYLIIIGVPSIIRAAVWNRYKLDYGRYFEGMLEKWADRLGGAA